MLHQAFSMSQLFPSLTVLLSESSLSVLTSLQVSYNFFPQEIKQ